MLCFVYGSLRPGEYNFERCVDTSDLEEVILNVTARGRLFHVWETSLAYPVARFDLTDGIIRGDLLRLRHPSRTWDWIHGMEAGAGYVLVDLNVELESGLSVRAHAWHYPAEDHGEEVPDGDWKALLDREGQRAGRG